MNWNTANEHVGSCCYRAQGLAVGGYPNERAPILWPFTWDSIWTMPIGDGAVYTPAGIEPGVYGLYA